MKDPIRQAVQTKFGFRTETIYRLRLPLLPYDELVRAVAEAADYWDIEVRSDRPDLPEVAAPPVAPEAELAAELAGDRDPRAGLAVDLLALMDEAGFIRATDAEAASALRTTPERVAAARRYLQERYGVGWPSLWAWWADALRTDASEDRETALQLLRALQNVGPAADLRSVRAVLRAARIPPQEGRRIVRRLILRYGLRPIARTAGAEAAFVPAGRTPDIEAVVTPGEVSYTVRVPRVVVRKTPADASTVATIACGPAVYQSIRRALLALPERRRRVLSAFFELAMEVNRDFFAGIRWYRLPVKPADLRAAFQAALRAARQAARRAARRRLTPEYRRLYNLVVRINGRDYPGYYVLGYDRIGNRIIERVPSELLERIAGESKDLGPKELRESLAGYGVSIGLTKAKKLLRRIRDGAQRDAEGRP